MEKKLNVAIEAKSFSPMFNLGSSVDTSVAFEHFNFCFSIIRRFEMDNGWSGAFRNFD